MVAHTHPSSHLHENQIEENLRTIPAEGMKGKHNATTDFHMPLSSKALRAIEPTHFLSQICFLLFICSHVPFSKKRHITAT
ncbi:hypothetical protein RM11_0968 [Bartonella quintana RM-11]|nr:hypothetical protein RM11_0968 [Bartonella quintana RM-11]